MRSLGTQALKILDTAISIFSEIDFSPVNLIHF